MKRKLNDKDYIHYLYKITNLNSGEYYIGVHSLLKSKNKEPITDGYWGSGTIIKLARKTIGKNNFKKEIISIENTRYDALNKERDLVSLNTLLDPLNYNISIGGQTSNKAGGILSPIYVNNKSKILFLTRQLIDSMDHSLYEIVEDEPQYVYEKLSNTITIWSEDKLATNENKTIEVLRPVLDHRDLETREKDKNLFKNKVVVVKVDDPNRIAIVMEKDDPRYLSGEYVGVMKGRKMPTKRTGSKTSGYNTRWITDGIKNQKIKKEDIIPEGWKLGRVITAEVRKHMAEANLQIIEKNKKTVTILNKLTNKIDTFKLDPIFFDKDNNLISPEKLQELFEPLNSWYKISKILNIDHSSLRKIKEFYISIGYNFYSSAIIHRPGRESFAVNKGRKVINNGITRKVVDVSQLNYYLENGWHLGSKPNK